MTLGVMVLLGIGIGVPFVLLEKRLLRKGLSTRPSAVPPPNTLAAIAAGYVGWALIQWLGTLPEADTINDRSFAQAGLAYALVHIDVLMFVLGTTRHPAATRLKSLWDWRASLRTRRVAGIGLALAATSLLVAPARFDAPAIRLLAATAGMVAGGLLLWRARNKRR